MKIPQNLINESNINVSVDTNYGIHVKFDGELKDWFIEHDDAYKWTVSNLTDKLRKYIFKVITNDMLKSIKDETQLYLYKMNNEGSDGQYSK